MDGELMTGVNGFQSPGNTSDTDSLNIRLGADASLTDLRGFFTGDLAELIVYDRILLPSERRLVEGYLSAKWNQPALEIVGDVSDMMLSWPVSPVPWRLETSSDLDDFGTILLTPTQRNHRWELHVPVVDERGFYRLARP